VRYSGAEAGYERIVGALADALAAARDRVAAPAPGTSTDGADDDDEGDDEGSGSDAAGAGASAAAAAAAAAAGSTGGPPPLRLRLRAFARRVLSLGNRTRSGGDAYEALDRALRHPALALIVPDSGGAEPVRVRVGVGPFRRPPRAGAAALDAAVAAGRADGGAEGGAEGGADGTGSTSAAGGVWGWGVRASVEATTRFALLAADPVDETSGRLAMVRATFHVRAAMPVELFAPTAGGVGGGEGGGGGEEAEAMAEEAAELAIVQNEGSVRLSVTPFG